MPYGIEAIDRDMKRMVDRLRVRRNWGVYPRLWRVSSCTVPTFCDSTLSSEPELGFSLFVVIFGELSAPELDNSCFAHEQVPNREKWQ